MGSTGRRLRARTTQAMKESSTERTRSRLRPTRGARLRYWFDATMARGTSALVGWLAVLTLALVLVFSVFTLITRWAPENEDGSRPGFFRQIFNSLMHALDPGTVAGDSGGAAFLITMLLLTVAGLFIVSALIGVIATGIDARLEELRRGRSLVIETDHTVVLGWGDAVFAIIRELAIANESRRRPAVVVLSDRDKVEMEEEIREKCGDLGGTRVVCRTGSPLDIGDLQLVNHAAARSVIVLSPGSDDPDTEVIKTLMALSLDGAEEPHVVAEIQDPQNLEAARMVGGTRTVIVDKRETIARLIVQTARQSGAAAVYTELFDFSGDEIYFHHDPVLAKGTYAEAVAAYESASVIGVVEPSGAVRLNPSPSTLIGNSEIVVVAEDDSALSTLARSTALIHAEAFSTRTPIAEKPSRILVLGWNERAVSVVRELDQYAEPGSVLEVVTEFGTPSFPDLANLSATVRRGRTAERATLAPLDVAGCDQVIVLCYSDDLPTQQADARTLVTLLHLRELIGERTKGERPSVVSEMLDDRNRALAQIAHVDDVIVSDEILSLILSQLSESRRLEAVFADLLDAEGAEIYLRPVEDYLQLDVEVNYATVVAAASRLGQTAIGYRTAADSERAEAGFGVAVNPPKSWSLVPAPGDRVIVLADD